MKFIDVTYGLGNTQFSINTDHIVAVSNSDGKAVIYTTSVLRGGNTRLQVNEAYTEVNSRIAYAVRG